jgi:hypothetical protein
MVLRERIELSTSPLPRECSTTELPQPMAGLLPYRTAKRKAKNKAKSNACGKARAGWFHGHGRATMLTMPE